MAQSRMTLPTQNLFGQRWVNTTFETWIDHFLKILAQPGGGMVVTPNSEIVMSAQSNPDLQRILQQSDYCLPDGIGVVWAGRILGIHLTQKLAGSDTVEALLPVFKGRIFLWGAAPGVAEQASNQIRLRYPHIQVAGSASGYYEPGAEPDIMRAIRGSGARLVWVGMGSPKQEQVMARLLSQCPDLWMMGVGGMLDLLAGHVQRAPLHWQRWGLEWLYRGYQQPARIKRWGALGRFGLWVWQQKLTGRRNRHEKF